MFGKNVFFKEWIIIINFKIIKWGEILWNNLEDRYRLVRLNIEFNR